MKSLNLMTLGLRHPADLHRAFIYRRISPNIIQTYAQLFPYIPKGSLVDTPYPSQYEVEMALSCAETFVADYNALSPVGPLSGSGSYTN